MKEAPSAKYNFRNKSFTQEMFVLSLVEFILNEKHGWQQKG
jgi:hypothetical protein